MFVFWFSEMQWDKLESKVATILTNAEVDMMWEVKTGVRRIIGQRRVDKVKLSNKSLYEIKRWLVSSRIIM